MPQSALFWIMRSAEFIAKEKLTSLPRGLRGVYVLYQHRRKADKYDVVYVGMAAAGRRGGMRGRLRSHSRSVRKGDLWTHFSVFEVWPNINDDQVAELEGLFRHIYRKDTKANRLNVQRGFKKLRSVIENDLEAWGGSGRRE